MSEIAYFKAEVESAHRLKVAHKPRWSAQDMATLLIEIECLEKERDLYRHALCTVDYAVTVAKEAKTDA